MYIHTNSFISQKPTLLNTEQKCELEGGADFTKGGRGERRICVMILSTHFFTDSSLILTETKSTPDPCLLSLADPHVSPGCCSQTT